MIRRATLAPITSLFLSLAACTGAATGTAVTTGATVSSCGSPGANTNEHDVGDEPGGVALDLGELAVSPTGAFVVFKGLSDLLVGWPSDSHVERLTLSQPTKLAFSKKRTVIYVGSAADGRIHAIDVALNEEIWSAPIAADSAVYPTLISASKDDGRVVVSAGKHVTLLDAHTGAVITERVLAAEVVDLQILPDDERAVAVTQGSWGMDATAPSTVIEVLALADGKASSFTVPNCSSPLAITPDGARAFLSPTLCNKDPISLIDLTPGKEGWVKNLPGFGPLALGPDGDMAVAFLDAFDVDATLFDDPAKIPPDGPNDPQYYLMTLDTHTLEYGLTVWGAEIPRYFLTPDGRSLLVDDPFGGGNATSKQPRIFDTESRTFRVVAGAPVELDDFVATDDSKHVYALSNGLVDLDIAAAKSTPMDMGGVTPWNINTSPDGQTLYLRTGTNAVCIYDIAAAACTGEFVGPRTR